ncbi:MAG TPA: CaiB/BaiF CoA-transferase family protein [Candidatus Limnocylindria bacterium]|nr:CaiB/BaiF CoA-transferase family protein [Candidatus Limnocylindria bacterium]
MSDTPLAGLRVLELGAFIAGPFAGQLLGDLGADVVKIEPPATGDIMRRYGVRVAKSDGRVESLWWPAIARNKRSAAIDLRDERGRGLVRRIAARCDIVLENFKPGTVDAWGLSYETLVADNPRAILVHVSGFGQSGPRAGEPGFGSIGEAMGGIRHTTGEPDRPPARTGISIGDSLAALFGVIGTLTALHERSRSGRGQEVDVAIYEAVLALMESTVADYEIGGVIRTRAGGVLRDVAPANAYPTADGRDVVIAGNADAVFARLCEAMQRPDLARDVASHEARAAQQDDLDREIGRWTVTMTADELVARLRAHDVPVGPINRAPELASDPHIAARDMIVRLAAGFDQEVAMAGVVPKLSRTPGSIRNVGPALGAHTDEVLRELADAGDEELATLRDAGVIV